MKILKRICKLYFFNAMGCVTEIFFICLDSVTDCGHCRKHFLSNRFSSFSDRYQSIHMYIYVYVYRDQWYIYRYTIFLFSSFAFRYLGNNPLSRVSVKDSNHWYFESLTRTLFLSLADSSDFGGVELTDSLLYTHGFKDTRK